jgi:RNA polymerase sigma-70 factor (ECF subfamily)
MSGTRDHDGDFDLLAQFNAGSEEAFARLVERHAGGLINFLFRYTRDRAASEDLAQEAFLRLYRAAPDLKPRAKLSTILFKFAYHLAVDRARRAAVRRDVTAESLDAAAVNGHEPAAPGEDPGRIMEKTLRDREVAEALASLPDHQRLAILLRVYEDRSYSEIAEILETSVPSVESLLFRARRSLAEKLKK